MADEPFLARWSRRKAAGPAPVETTTTEWPAAQAVSTGAATTPPVDVAEAPAIASGPAPEPELLPTLDDVALLTRQSDYSRFVGPRVDRSVSNAAMKKLFADPRYNIMDGLDTYIDDYGKPDPIPMAMLRKMHQSIALGLFDHEKDEQEKAGPERVEPEDAHEAAQASTDGEPAVPMAKSAFGPTEPVAHPEPLIDDDDADLRLQQDDAVERPGSGPRARG